MARSVQQADSREQRARDETPSLDLPREKKAGSLTQIADPETPFTLRGEARAMWAMGWPVNSLSHRAWALGKGTARALQPEPRRRSCAPRSAVRCTVHHSGHARANEKGR